MAMTTARGGKLREMQRQLDELLARQAATADVLHSISASPNDAAPVFETIVNHAVRLCDAHFAFVMEHRQGRLWLAARTACTPEFALYLEKGIECDRTTTTGRAAVERGPVQIADFQAAPGIVATPAHGSENVRTVLAVPLLREASLLGVIAVWRREVREFSDTQVRLIEEFARQAVVAIDNARLFKETKEALEQKAATAEILRVIAKSPGDVQPVFDAIARNAAILCESLFANVFRYDGEMVHFVATHGFPSHLLQRLHDSFPTRPNSSRVAGRTILAGGVVRVEDVLSDADYDQGLGSRLGGYRRILGVPMLRDGSTVGAIVVSWARPGPIDKRHEDLLGIFADQAVIAIENVRLFHELQEKSRELELANTFKSRFLSAASHDLRQPLHALNLFVAQLRAEASPAERGRLVTQIDAGLGAMNELFGALLDVSKLDAGVLDVNSSEFPVGDMLKRVETTFAGAAREKGLRLRVVPCGAWIRSDFILLERILGNLVSNAVRYTAAGGVVVGCRRRGESLRLEVWDSGPGIPEDQRRNVFREFYQVNPAAQGRATGLGLGLAIVERLGHLLGHAVELNSAVGKGSVFSISVPRVAGERRPPVARAPKMPGDPGGKLIVVIDDDALVLEAMRGILESWGCRVVAAKSVVAALGQLEETRQRADLIISDFRLAEGQSGIHAIEALRRELGGQVPAFLISGDTAPERLREASASHFNLLHKPVQPMMLRSMVGRLLSRGA